MVEVQMTTSELEKAILAEISLIEFCIKYRNIKDSLKSRIDGAITSGDMNIEFDSAPALITEQDLNRVKSAVISGEIDNSDANFLANAILLSAFEFENDAVEQQCLSMSETY